MTDLRTSLRRLADSTDPLPVDDDLWGRAQAGRRRGRVALAATVVALVVVLGGGVALWQAPDREARTAAGEVPGGAIPRMISDVPAGLDPTSDLAVGRASVAFISGEGDPVVVTAADGVAHVLDLPSFGPDRAAYALSPDGRQLAYGAQPEGSLARIEVVDLESGRSRAYGSANTDSLEIDTLSWSPDGRWLGWASTAVGDQTGSVGTIRIGGRTQRDVIVDGTAPQVAAADDGTLAVSWVGGALAINHPKGPLDRVRPAPPGAAGAFSPDGRLLALGSGPGRASYTLDVEGHEVLRHPFPDGTFDDAVVRPLGWLDDRLQLLLVAQADASSAELVVTTPAVDATSTWRRSAGAVGSLGVANSLTVAVDLLPDLDGTSSQELTHDFGATTSNPLAFGGIEVSVLIGLGVAAAIAVLMLLRLALRALSRRFRAG